MGPPPTPPPPRSPQKPKWAGAVLLRGKTAFHKVVWVKRYVVVDRALGTLKLYKGAKAPAAGAKARSALPLNSCALNLNAQGPKKSDALTLLEFASQERFTLSAPVGHGGLAAFLAETMDGLRGLATPGTHAKRRTSEGELERECAAAAAAGDGEDVAPRESDAVVDDDDEPDELGGVEESKEAPPEEEQPAKPPPPPMPRGNLLAELHRGAALKKAEETDRPNPRASTNDLQMSALKSVLKHLKQPGDGDGDDDDMDARDSDARRAQATDVKKTCEPCGDYRVDVTAAAFGTCVCGWPKASHGAAVASSATGGRVRDVLAAYEDMMRAAERRAAEEEELLRSRDPSKIAAALARKRAQTAAPREGPAPPTFANVAGARGELRVKIEAPGPFLYAVARDGAALPADFEDWTGGTDEATVVLGDKGRYLFAAIGEDGGGARSDVATAYFTLEDPEFLFHEAHAHELAALGKKYASGSLACGLCGATVEDPGDGGCAGYRSLVDEPFALCRACAFPAGGDRPAVTVAVDVGARRLWLSEPVRFVGNDVAVVDESLPLVAMLADALGRHAGIVARLEGHANSRCGLDCDGSSDCANAKCRKLFGSRGGAVGFSYRRANAVVEHLVAAGVDGASVSAVGLAGSRRIVDDPEAADNYRNRRVEIHCA